MIQRFQSVFLAVAVVFMITTFFVPVALFNAGDVHAMFTNYGWLNEKGAVVKSYPVYIGVGVVCAVLLVTIFMYKNRRKQILFCRISYLLLLGQFALYFFLPDAGVSALVETGTIKQAVGFYLPLGALGFVYLAEMLIRKDDNLVKSADRLR